MKNAKAQYKNVMITIVDYIKNQNIHKYWQTINFCSKTLQTILNTKT